MQTGIDPSIYYHRGMHWYEDAATLQCMRRHLIHNPLAQRHDLVFAKISVHARNQSQTALYWMSGSLHVTYAYKKDNFLTTRVYKLISYVVYILILEGGGVSQKCSYCIYCLYALKISVGVALRGLRKPLFHTHPLSSSCRYKSRASECREKKKTVITVILIVAFDGYGKSNNHSIHTARWKQKKNCKNKQRCSL